MKGVKNMRDESWRTNDIENAVRKYADMVYRIALARTRSESDAQDVFQEVFLRYCRHRDKLTDETHERAWLARVTINCSKSLLRSAWNRRTVPLDESLPFCEPEASGVYEAVMALPVKYRTVVHLHYGEGFTLSEIAQTLHTNENTVKTRLRRAREQLRTTLKGERGDV